MSQGVLDSTIMIANLQQMFTVNFTVIALLSLDFKVLLQCCYSTFIGGSVQVRSSTLYTTRITLTATLKDAACHVVVQHEDVLVLPERF